MSGRISAEQMRAARGWLRWSQKDLAAHSGVSLPTIKRLELGEGEIGGYPVTANAIRAAFENGGIEFLPTSQRGGSGIRIRASEGFE